MWRESLAVPLTILAAPIYLVCLSFSPGYIMSVEKLPQYNDVANKSQT